MALLMPDDETDETKDESKNDIITVEGFLYIGKKGGIRASKTRCSVKEDEIRTSVSIQVPRALFEKDAINVSVVIPDSLQFEIDANTKKDAGTW